MKFWLKWLATDLEAVLALVIFLSGLLLLPHVHAASSQDILVGLEVLPFSQCQDTVDNDNDGLIDYPADLDCDGPSDNSESTSLSNSSGVGGGGSGGSSTSGSPATPATPSTPLPSAPSPSVPSPIPFLQPTSPSATVQLVDIAPKLFNRNATTRIYIYLAGMASDALTLQVVGHDGTYTTNASGRSNDNRSFERGRQTVSFVLPAGALSPGINLATIKTSRQTLGNAEIYMYPGPIPTDYKMRPVNYPATLTLAPGETKTITIEYRNVGTRNFTKYLDPVYVGTASPFDRISAFATKDWGYDNRPAKAPLPASLKPGESLKVSFALKAPDVIKSGIYPEYFALVSDGLMWVPASDFQVAIKIKAPTDPEAKTTTTKVSKVKATTAQVVLPFLNIFKPVKTTILADDSIGSSPYQKPSSGAYQSNAFFTSVVSLFSNLFR
jgi:hypothetical protein